MSLLLPVLSTEHPPEGPYHRPPDSSVSTEIKFDSRVPLRLLLLPLNCLSDQPPYPLPYASGEDLSNPTDTGTLPRSSEDLYRFPTSLDLDPVALPPLSVPGPSLLRWVLSYVSYPTPLRPDTGVISSPSRRFPLLVRWSVKSFVPTTHQAPTPDFPSILSRLPLHHLKYFSSHTSGVSSKSPTPSSSRRVSNCDVVHSFHLRHPRLLRSNFLEPSLLLFSTYHSTSSLPSFSPTKIYPSRLVRMSDSLPSSPFLLYLVSLCFDSCLGFLDSSITVDRPVSRDLQGSGPS